MFRLARSFALELFGCRDQEAFCVSQFDGSTEWAPEDVKIWTELNESIKSEVQVTTFNLIRIHGMTAC
jgi:hypothetical protein